MRIYRKGLRSIRVLPILMRSRIAYESGIRLKTCVDDLTVFLRRVWHWRLEVQKCERPVHLWPCCPVAPRLSKQLHPVTLLYLQTHCVNYLLQTCGAKSHINMTHILLHLLYNVFHISGPERAAYLGHFTYTEEIVYTKSFRIFSKPNSRLWCVYIYIYMVTPISTHMCTPKNAPTTNTRNNNKLQIIRIANQ